MNNMMLLKLKPKHKRNLIMKKELFAVACVALTLTGCKCGKDKPKTVDQPTTTAPVAVEPAPTTEPTMVIAPGQFHP